MTHASARTYRLLAVLILVSLAACANGAQQPRNVILIIGDGMGIGAITAARCAGPGENGRLTLDTMPVAGLVKTHSNNSLVTDSAASATALATGHKTDNGRISTTSDGKTLTTILDLAIDLGKSTGVVTTDAVTSATPACYYAHTDARGKEEDIAGQLVKSKLVVAMGSGKDRFVPKTSDQAGRADGSDLIAAAKAGGFGVAFDAKQMEACGSRKLLGLFTFDESGPTLEAMTNKAVSLLAANHKGFFVMVESCLPDKGGHHNDLPTNTKGVLDLDAALKAVLAFAAKDGGTLVLVTADHETGGLAVLGKNEKNPVCTPGWVCGSHTGNMVPIYAYGPGSQVFTGTHDNTEIPKLIAKLWGKTLSQ